MNDLLQYPNNVMLIGLLFLLAVLAAEWRSNRRRR